MRVFIEVPRVEEKGSVEMISSEINREIKEGMLKNWDKQIVRAIHCVMAIISPQAAVSDREYVAVISKPGIVNLYFRRKRAERLYFYEHSFHVGSFMLAWPVSELKSEKLKEAIRARAENIIRDYWKKTARMALSEMEIRC